MNNTTTKMSRRHFIATTGTIAGTALLNPISELKADTKSSTALPGKKARIAHKY